MTIRTTGAEWNANLARGSGQMRLGSAHAGSFLTALRLEPTKAERSAQRWMDDTHLETKACVPDLVATELDRYAQAARKNCAVSQALRDVDIHLRVQLL